MNDSAEIQHLTAPLYGHVYIIIMAISRNQNKLTDFFYDFSLIECPYI